MLLLYSPVPRLLGILTTTILGMNMCIQTKRMMAKGISRTRGRDISDLNTNSSIVAYPRQNPMGGNKTGNGRSRWPNYKDGEPVYLDKKPVRVVQIVYNCS